MSRVRLTVSGVVQGVGFRPFVYRAAASRHLRGWVQNRRDSVVIEVEGSARDVAAFGDHLRASASPPIHIASIEATSIPEGVDTTFSVLPSVAGERPGMAIVADLATCAACLQEVQSPSERRHRYPFTSCSQCGPRYSIVNALPYDRSRTSMVAFALCVRCAREYGDPADRRFHAEPIACPACGPSIEILDPDGSARAHGAAALEAAARSLLRGEVLALKGLGGFQLLVDATRDEPIALLRDRKRREAKPLAVMLPDIEAARAFSVLSELDEALLQGPEAPILLVRRRDDCPLPSLLAPGSHRLGIMLPTTPLHHLLLARCARPLVCTSGNLGEEPMCIDEGSALARLGKVADRFLVHDRPIVRPVDDSVARAGPRGVELLRRARGFTPLPVGRARCGRTLVGVGGHLKSTVALSCRGSLIVSQHLGDLEAPSAVALHERTALEWLRLGDARADAIACDLHPDYASTRLAERLAADWGVPLLRIQHHEAHVAAVLAEHGIEGEVLGLAWDGNGFGLDSAIWGGEALAGEAGALRRVAHLRPFRLPGGDRAAREPRRSALGLLHEAMGSAAEAHLTFAFEPRELQVLLGALASGVNCPPTTAMGRLFDGVAALAGVRSLASFEAQAAIELELAAERQGLEGVSPYSLPLRSAGPARVADWEPLVLDLLDDKRSGVPIDVIAARFHAALVELGAAIARQVSLPRVVLSGGCFQNAVLVRALESRLERDGFEVFTPARLPPNDGAISVGQVWTASARLDAASR